MKLWFIEKCRTEHFFPIFYCVLIGKRLWIHYSVLKGYALRQVF